MSLHFKMELGLSDEESPTLKMTRKILLICGIVSAVLYVVMNIVTAIRWEEYSSFSQTVSELSAVNAPTRPLWIALAIPYSILGTAFGCGIWISAKANLTLRITGGLIVVYGLSGFAWPPMHLREVLAAGGGTTTDMMHIVFSIVTVILMLLAIGFGAAAFGRQFRIYSVVTIVLLIAFGALTTKDTPEMQINLPTPWMGVWERICIGIFLLWQIVLAAILLSKNRTNRYVSGTLKLRMPPKMQGHP